MQNYYRRRQTRVIFGGDIHTPGFTMSESRWEYMQDPFLFLILFEVPMLITD